jgi:transglutaminase-like putative cysteine protease
MLVLQSGFCAIITLSDGSSKEVENPVYSGDKLKAVIDGNEVEFDRSQIKDISFSGRKQKSAVMASDSADLPELYKKAIDLFSRYPDSNYVVVKEEGNYQHRTDGTNLSRNRSVRFVSREEALWNAQVSLTFDPHRERIKILHARSFSPDGQAHTLSPDQIKISKRTSGSVNFDQYQQMRFTIPEVKVGSLVDYSYEVEEFNPFDVNLFQGGAYFQRSVPVGESTLRVSIPHDKKLYYYTRNCENYASAPEIIEGVGSIIYSWRFTDVPALVSEPYMPAYRDVVPSVFYSLHKTYDYVHNKLKPMFEKRFELTDHVKNKVDEIVAGAENLHEKIARLYLYCQKEIRYISIKGNLASNQVGHPAEETLKNKYGDCTDKGMLLATMLKHIGVEAYPVGVRTNTAGRGVKEIAIFDDNHCITEIHLDGRVFYLDSTATDYRYPYFRSDDHDTIAENTMLGTLNHIPTPPPEDNSSTVIRNLELKADGTTRVEYENRQNGTNEAYSREAARNLKPEEYEKQIRAAVANLTADYELELATHTNPLDFSSEFTSRSIYTLNRYAPRSGKYMIFSIPYFQISFPEVSLEKRQFPIEYTTTNLKTEQISIKIPEGYNVKYLPPALRIQSPYVEFEVIFDQKGDHIRVSRKLAFPRRVIPVADYQSYKSDLERIAFSSKERIFLEKVTSQDSSKTDEEKIEEGAK